MTTFPSNDQVIAALLAYYAEGPLTTYPQQVTAMRRALVAAVQIGGLPSCPATLASTVTK